MRSDSNLDSHGRGVRRCSPPSRSLEGLNGCYRRPSATDERPHPTKLRLAEAGFHAPLDLVDGHCVARVGRRSILIDAKAAQAAGADPRSLALSWGSRQLLEQVGAWPVPATEIHQIHVSRKGQFGRSMITRDEHSVPALGYVTRYGDLVTVLAGVVSSQPGRDRCVTDAGALRAELTRIRALGGEQVVMSNTELLKQTVSNYKRLRERRIVFGFGVTYATSPDQAAAIPEMVKRIVEESGKLRFDRAHLKAFGESSLDYEVVYIVLDPDFGLYMNEQQRINLSLMRELDAMGVGFAFPTRTVVLDGSAPLRVAQVPAESPVA